MSPEGCSLGSTGFGLAILLTLWSTTPGLAERRGKEDLKRHCSGDVTTYCGDVGPDGEAMDSCSAKHRQELSENFSRFIDAYDAKGGR